MLPINIKSEFEKYVVLLILPASIKESFEKKLQHMKYSFDI